MSLTKESFPQIPLFLKSFTDVESIPSIFYLIEEFLNFKGFIEGTRHWKAILKCNNLSSLLNLMVVP
jgi:hypothetical protein